MVPWNKAPVMTCCNDEKSSDSNMGVIKQGYIFKQSHSMLKNWRTRYLVLTVDCIHIYKRQGDLGNLPSEIISFDGLSVILEDGNDKRRKFCLKISSSTSPVSRRGYLLCFFTEQERTEWCTRILETVTTRWILEKESRETPLRLASRLVGLQSRSMETLSHGALRSPPVPNFRGRERPRSMEITTLHSTGLFTGKQGTSRPNCKGLLTAKLKSRPFSFSTEFLSDSRDSVLLPM